MKCAEEISRAALQILLAQFRLFGNAHSKENAPAVVQALQHSAEAKAANLDLERKVASLQEANDLLKSEKEQEALNFVRAVFIFELNDEFTI